MADTIKSSSRNTELFASLPPEVATIINDVIHAIYTILCWSQASKSFLTEILSRLAEAESFSQDHADFSAALWSHLNAKRRREKISRWIARLKKDMDLSRFNPIYIPKQVVIRTEEGGYKGQATVYRIGHFWKLFRYVQDMAREIDLLSLPVNKRRAQVRVFVSEWLEEAGAVKVVREKKEKGEREGRDAKAKAGAIACKCACVSCAHCAGKSANESEATGAERLRSQPNESFEVELEKFADFFERYLREFGRIDKRYTYAVKRAHNALDIAEQSAADLIIRERTGHQLKIVGGQSK